MSFNAYSAIGYCWMALAAVWLAGFAFTKQSVHKQPSSGRIAEIGLALLGGLIISGRLSIGSWGDVRFAPHTESTALAGFALLHSRLSPDSHRSRHQDPLRRAAHDADLPRRLPGIPPPRESPRTRRSIALHVASDNPPTCEWPSLAPVRTHLQNWPLRWFFISSFKGACKV